MRDDAGSPEEDECCHGYLRGIMEGWCHIGQQSDDYESETPEDIDDRVISNLEGVEEEEDIGDEESRED